MSKTCDQGKDEVARLCRYFANNRQSFLAPGVKEAHVRKNLIDPLFEALGWDREMGSGREMGSVLDFVTLTFLEP